MSTKIRHFQEIDREQVLALAPRLTHGVAVWRDPTAVRNAVIAWVEDSLEALTHENHSAVLVAEEDGVVHGFITVGKKRHWAGDLDAYLGELVVSPAAEGMGTGSARIRAAMEWAKAEGLRRVSVSTGAANKRARHIYQALGFQEEDISLCRSI